MCVIVVSMEMKHAFYILCVCSLSYLVWKVHATYYMVICGQFVFTIIFHNISQMARISERRFAHKKCLSCFPINSVSNISRSETNWTRYYYKLWYIRILAKHLTSLSDFNETWIFSVGFRKIFTCPTSRKSVQWKRSIPCGRTDRHDEANSRFSQFFECA